VDPLCVFRLGHFHGRASFLKALYEVLKSENMAWCMELIREQRWRFEVTHILGHDKNYPRELLFLHEMRRMHHWFSRILHAAREYLDI
jgi:hypothetical protein